jgi:hypothetical protein
MSNSAGQGMSSLSSMQNSQNAADGANAAGYGRMGATVANTLFKADGGIARARHLASGGAVKLAAGGIPQSPVVGWRDRMAAMPSISRGES